jgi:acetolactate synthase-1/2/3 large subunit
VCLATLGPGATNFVTAAAYAQLGAMPMLMITGQKPVKASKQGHFQIVDIVDMMKPLTKYTRQIVSADNIPARVREAFRRAEEERPGAVHLELPEDIADERDGSAVIKASHVAPPGGGRQIDRLRAVEAITNAKRPLLMVGAGANRKTTSKMLPSSSTSSASPSSPRRWARASSTRRPLWLGNAALSDGDFVHRAIEKADCIINCGHDVIEKPPFFMRTGLRTVIHLNFFSAEVDTVYFPQIEVVGDMANSIWRLKQAPGTAGALGLRLFRPGARMRSTRTSRCARTTSASRSTRSRWSVSRCAMRSTRTASCASTTACTSSGSRATTAATSRTPCCSTTRWRPWAPACRAAIAAKMVHPDRKVVAVAGDGGFMMNSQELETAVRYNLNIAVIVLRDNAYGMIKWKQAGMGFPTSAWTWAIRTSSSYAEAYGARGWRPKSTEEFRQNLRQALAEPGVDLIELAIDYSENHAILNKEIKELSAAM